MGFSYTSWNMLREHWAFFYFLFFVWQCSLRGWTGCASSFQENYLDRGDNCTGLLLCDLFYLFILKNYSSWVFWRGQKDKSRLMLNEVMSSQGERGMQLIPQIKLNCKEQSKTTPGMSQNFVQSGIRVSGSWNVSAVIPCFDFFLPSLFSSLIPAVLGIKKEINTPLKSPNTNNQVCYF